MMLKISCDSKEKFDHTLAAILEISCMVANSGIPVPERERTLPEIERSRMWCFANNSYDLAPVSNSYKAHVKDSGENMVVLWFVYRYDRGRHGIMDALMRLLHARFPEETELIEE